MGHSKTRKYKETSYLQEAHRYPIYGVAFNHFNTKDHIFASAGSNRATVYKCLKDGTIEVLQVYHDADINEDYYACQWSIDLYTGAPLLVIGGHHGLLRVINCVTGAVLCTLEGHGNCINDIAVHPLFPFLVATGSRDHSVRVYNIKTKVCVVILQGDGGHRNEVISVDWKVDSDHFFRHQHCATGGAAAAATPNNRGATGGGSRGKGKDAVESTTMLPYAYASGVHPCESLLATAGMDNTVKVWSLADFKDVLDSSMEWTDEMAAKASFRPRHVRVPIFSNDCVHTDATMNYIDCVKWHGDFIVSKSVDNKIIQWQPEIASSEEKQSYKAGRVKLVQTFKLEDCMKVWFCKFALDRSQTVLAVGTGRGKTLVFEPNVLGSAPVCKLTPHRLSERTRKNKKVSKENEEIMLVRQIAVSYDGDIIISSHEDGTITRFDRSGGGSGGGGGDGTATGQEEEEDEEEEEEDEEEE